VQVWRVVGAIGRFMMRAGVLVLLFVAYQLWGTGLTTQRAQDSLENQFASQLATTTSSTSTTADTTADTTDTAGTATSTLPPATAPTDVPPPANGDPVARIRIPAIGVDYIVIQGVDIADLKEGPGHFPQTPLPGQPGNVALAGHRTTYLAPFARLDELRPGDQIIFDTVQGEFTYTVDPHAGAPGDEPSGHFIVKPTQVEILAQGDTNMVTLMACHPKYSARERIVVTGTLTTPPAPATPVASPSADSGSVTTDASLDALAGGDGSAWGPAIAWSVLALAIWFATWWLARWWARRDSGRDDARRRMLIDKVIVYAVGAPVFLVVLFVAYENIARLLPAAY
jgi:sortase A